MSESAERGAAGEARAGQPCGWCKAELAAEDQAAACAECGSLHHEECWDRELGCCVAGCFNAPLTRLDAGEPAPDAPPARKPALFEPPRFVPGSFGSEARAAARRRRPKPSVGARKLCVGCGEELPRTVEICGDCLTINTPDGLYHGPTTTAPLAREALIIAIVGFFLCGPILGPVAIGRANSARDQIRKDPRLSGDGLAIAAMVLGIVDLAMWMLGIISSVGGSR